VNDILVLGEQFLYFVDGAFSRIERCILRQIDREN